MRVDRMPKVGFEPTWGNPHYALNVARLPIPPLRLADDILPYIAHLSTFLINRRFIRFAHSFSPCYNLL